MKIFRLFVAFTLVCFALSPAAQAVVPPPDGGYPNFTTAEGDHALQALTLGVGNTAIGTFSLFSVTTGDFNTAVGAGALDLNIGNNNTATGAAALLFNTAGTENTAHGTAALEFNSTGGGNTATGAFALFSNTKGDQNTAVGVNALLNADGSGDIALGMNAGSALTTGGNNIDLGNVGVADESDTIRIGATQTKTFVAGIYGVMPLGPDPLPVGIDSNGQLGTVSSPSTQAVVTGSRALNTVYLNTGAKPLFVAVSCGLTGGGASAKTDSTTDPTTVVASMSGSGAAPPAGELFFIVLPGNYYKVSSSGGTVLSHWTEWQ